MDDLSNRQGSGKSLPRLPSWLPGRATAGEPDGRHSAASHLRSDRHVQRYQDAGVTCGSSLALELRSDQPERASRRRKD